MHEMNASYSSPTNEAFKITKSLSPPASGSPTDKSVYLSSLRSAVLALQDGVNRELTARMEEDNAKSKLAGAGVDDSKEEENYGEDIQ
ncbi:hypothetical protein Cpir12675_005964 [Ceratocystis pirilliformis]|uniref:EKC/KEOPS complex subunit GON7 n=1 Tax=Ceratocystis pirilliformis TaxID=259994 RepID=A0ABR3YL24_9PEZI